MLMAGGVFADGAAGPRLSPGGRVGGAALHLLWAEHGCWKGRKKYVGARERGHDGRNRKIYLFLWFGWGRVGGCAGIGLGGAGGSLKR